MTRTELKTQYRQLITLLDGPLFSHLPGLLKDEIEDKDGKVRSMVIEHLKYLHAVLRFHRDATEKELKG